MADIVEAIC